MIFDINGKPNDRQFNELVDALVLEANAAKDIEVTASIHTLDLVARKTNRTFYEVFYDMIKNNESTFRKDENACGHCVLCKIVVYVFGTARVVA